MTDPQKNIEIEDVLSSIRRLVSEEGRPRPRPPEAEKLVLTQALRVGDEPATPERGTATLPEAGSSDDKAPLANESVALTWATEEQATEILGNDAAEATPADSDTAIAPPTEPPLPLHAFAAGTSTERPSSDSSDATAETTETQARPDPSPPESSGGLAGMVREELAKLTQAEPAPPNAEEAPATTSPRAKAEPSVPDALPEGTPAATDAQADDAVAKTLASLQSLVESSEAALAAGAPSVDSTKTEATASPLADDEHTPVDGPAPFDAFAALLASELSSDEQDQDDAGEELDERVALDSDDKASVLLDVASPTEERAGLRDDTALNDETATAPQSVPAVPPSVKDQETELSGPLVLSTLAQDDSRPELSPAAPSEEPDARDLQAETTQADAPVAEPAVSAQEDGSDGTTTPMVVQEGPNQSDQDAPDPEAEEDGAPASFVADTLDLAQDADADDIADDLAETGNEDAGGLPLGSDETPPDPDASEDISGAEDAVPDHASASDAESDIAVASDPSPLSVVTPMPQRAGPPDAPDLRSDPVGSEQRALDDDAVALPLDEDALRDLVAEIVRQELQGALGERITRNVRKLVRREIHRVLVSQDFD